MTGEPSLDFLGLPATRTADGRTMIGHVIVCRSDPAGEIAIWHVDTQGMKTGAWVTTDTLASPDLALARRDYLRATFGRPAVLPSAWEFRLADAFANLR